MLGIKQRLLGIIQDDLAKVAEVVLSDEVLVVSGHFDGEVSYMALVQNGQCEVSHLQTEAGTDEFTADLVLGTVHRLGARDSP